MGVAIRTNGTRLFRSWCGWCHTICVRIPRADCAPKLMQERRVVTFELWWLDHNNLDEKNQIEWMPVRVGTEFETKKITRSYCADQYSKRTPRTSWKSIGLAQIRLGRLSDTREAGNKTTGPDFPPRSKVLLLLTPINLNKWMTMIRRGKLFFSHFSCFWFLSLLFFTETSPAILNTVGRNAGAFPDYATAVNSCGICYLSGSNYN